MSLNYNVSFLCYLFFVFSPFLLLGQISLEEEINPFFKVEKVEFPKHLKALKNKAIVGAFPDNRILVRTTHPKEPKSGERVTKKYFEVKRLGKNKVDIQESNLDLSDISEIASIDYNKIYYTKEYLGNHQFCSASYDENGQLDFDTETYLLPNWKNKIENPCLFKSPNSKGLILIFSSIEKGKKDYDLFYSKHNDNWNTPLPLNNQINTSYDEKYPYISCDGYLFFSSNQPTRADKVSRRKDLIYHPYFVAPGRADDLWVEEQVTPLFMPIKSLQNEQTVVVHREGLGAGFFTSDRENDRFELFTFERDDIDFDTTVQEYHALVIGVSDYKVSSDLPTIKNALPNAEELKQILHDNYDFKNENIALLPNPSNQEIIDALNSYHHLGENDNLIIAFLGHGIALPSPDNPELCVLAGSDGKKDGTNCLHPDEYARILNQYSQPRQILTLIDACFGGLFKSNVSSVVNNKSRKIMTSTKDNIVVDDSDFFRYLIAKLKIPQYFCETLDSKELFDYIYEYCKSNPDKQIPTYRDFFNDITTPHFVFPPKIH